MPGYFLQRGKERVYISIFDNPLIGLRNGLMTNEMERKTHSFCGICKKKDIDKDGCHCKSINIEMTKIHQRWIKKKLTKKYMQTFKPI